MTAFGAFTVCALCLCTQLLHRKPGKWKRRRSAKTAASTFMGGIGTQAMTTCSIQSGVSWSAEPEVAEAAPTSTASTSLLKTFNNDSGNGFKIFLCSKFLDLCSSECTGLVTPNVRWVLVIAVPVPRFSCPRVCVFECVFVSVCLLQAPRL